MHKVSLLYYECIFFLRKSSFSSAYPQFAICRSDYILIFLEALSSPGFKEIICYLLSFKKRVFLRFLLKKKLLLRHLFEASFFSFLLNLLG